MEELLLFHVTTIAYTISSHYFRFKVQICQFNVIISQSSILPNTSVTDICPKLPKMWKSSIIVFISYVLFIPITLAMGDVRSEDQWVSLRVFNRMRTHDIEFKNASLSW